MVEYRQRAGQSCGAFWIRPDGVVTEIIDFMGDTQGNNLDGATGVTAVDSGRVYVTGEISNSLTVAEVAGTSLLWPKWPALWCAALVR